MPSYPSTQRSPGSRPLPSAGISVVGMGFLFVLEIFWGLVCVFFGFIWNVVFSVVFLEKTVKWQ